MKDKGLAGLRQHRLPRITKEAIEQGALLSYEDIAFNLTTSVITIKRDMAFLRHSGLTIPSRGWRHDMGRGSTHKTQILNLYLSGYQFSEIQQCTHHSETAVKRYIQDFSKIILLYSKGLIRIKKCERWTHQAYDQGALLTNLNLAMFMGVNENNAAEYVREYYSLYKRKLPTRGNIQFLGSGQTHKKEIVTLYFNGYLVPTICQRTNHSKDAVEHYIRDFEAIRMFDIKFDDMNSISLITRLSKRVVQHYIELIPMEN